MDIRELIAMKIMERREADDHTQKLINMELTSLYNELYKGGTNAKHKKLGSRVVRTNR